MTLHSAFAPILWPVSIQNRLFKSSIALKPGGFQLRQNCLIAIMKIFKIVSVFLIAHLYNQTHLLLLGALGAHIRERKQEYLQVTGKVGNAIAGAPYIDQGLMYGLDE